MRLHLILIQDCIDLSIKQARLAYKLEINEFRGNRSLQLLVDYIEPIDE